MEQSSELSVRWWNQRFRLRCWFHIHCILQTILVAVLPYDNWFKIRRPADWVLTAISVSGQSGMLGRTMGEIFAEFLYCRSLGLDQEFTASQILI